MPVLPNSSGSIRLQLIGVNQGSLWMNNIHFQTDSGGSVPQDTSQIATFCAAVATAWGAQIAALCNTAVELQTLVFTDLTDTDRVQFTHTVPTPIAGTRGAPDLPTSAAMCLSWRASLRYRGGHGRIYVPAGLHADIDNGRTWDSGFLGAANTAAGNFRTTLDGLSVGSQQVNLIVLSYYSGSHKTESQPHPPPVLRPTPLPLRVTSARVRSRVDTQRRRLGKEVV
jgi:hypothetical protein